MPSGNKNNQRDLIKRLAAQAYRHDHAACACGIIAHKPYPSSSEQLGVGDGVMVSWFIPFSLSGNPKGLTGYDMFDSDCHEMLARYRITRCELSATIDG